MKRTKASAGAIYCRISQDRGGTELGVDRQEALCRKLAEDKGWTVAEVYVDNDLSAYSGRRRPRYEQMLTDVEAGRREAKIVREIAKRFLAGESLRSLAFELNDRQVPTCGGGPWRVTTIRSIITNPRYVGLRVHRGEIVGEASWKPILDRATHEQIR